MTLLSPRQLLPALVLILASLFLLAAVANAVQSAPSVPQDARYSVALAEIQLCEANGGRSRAECIEEEQGKALIRHAERENAQSEP